MGRDGNRLHSYGNIFHGVNQTKLLERVRRYVSRNIYVKNTYNTYFVTLQLIRVQRYLSFDRTGTFSQSGHGYLKYINDLETFNIICSGKVVQCSTVECIENHHFHG